LKGWCVVFAQDEYIVVKVFRRWNDQETLHSPENPLFSFFLSLSLFFKTKVASLEQNKGKNIW
jgi:hypothetical protein